MMLNVESIVDANAMCSWAFVFGVSIVHCRAFGERNRQGLEASLQAVEGLAAKWDRKVVGGAVIDCS